MAPRTKLNKPKKRRVCDEDDEGSPLSIASLFGGSDMLDPFQPVIRISGPFDDAMAREFEDSVNILKKRGEEKALIQIDSPGGSLYALFQMINCMDSSGVLFATYNASHAYSAGGVLLAAGAKGARFVAPLSSTMLHPLSTGVAQQQVADVLTEAYHDREINDMLMDRLAVYLGMSRLKLNKELQKPSEGGAATLWMTPKRCLELGIADVIGIPAFRTTTELILMTAEEQPEPAPKTRSRKKVSQ